MCESGGFLGRWRVCDSCEMEMEMEREGWDICRDLVRVQDYGVAMGRRGSGCWIDSQSMRSGCGYGVWLWLVGFLWSFFLQD